MSGAAGKVIYYAIVDAYSTWWRPAGVLRRTQSGGERRDEAFGRNLAWHPTGRYAAAMPAVPGDHGPGLHKVTSEEADRIVTSALRAAAGEQ